jgi:hypothetical protein
MAVGRVDGEPVIIMLTEAEGSWTPTSFVRLDAVDGRITQIRDYLQCPWILRSAAAVEIEGRA